LTIFCSALSWSSPPLLSPRGGGCSVSVATMEGGDSKTASVAVSISKPSISVSTSPVVVAFAEQHSGGSIVFASMLLLLWLYGQRRWR